MEGSSTWVYNNEQKHEIGELQCENCGKLVSVMLPFVGCVYCGDCMSATNNYWDKGSSNGNDGYNSMITDK